MTTSDGEDGGEEIPGQREEDPPHPGDRAYANGGGTKPAASKKTKDKTKHKPTMDVLMSIVHTMRASELGPLGRRVFPRIFKTMRLRGKTIMIELSFDGVASVVESKDDVDDAILNFSHTRMGGYDPQLESKHAREIRLQFRALETPIAEEAILPVGELSQNGLCWHRLPFDIIDDGPTPVFDEMISRTINGRALMAWIGSLIVADTDRSQYVYLYGEGANGKSRLADVLRRTFGPAYRAEEAPDRNNRFWTAGLIGSRLVVMADLDNPAFVNTGFFKTLTGEDAVRVEWKGGVSTNMNLHCKFMLLANKKLALDLSDANKRRAIFCEMLPLPEGTKKIPSAVYGAMLWDEWPIALGKCRAEWRKHTTTGSITMETPELLEKAIAAHEEIQLDLMDRWFILDPRASVLAKDMQRILRHERIRSPTDQSKWKNFLERRYKIYRGKSGPATDRHHAYIGMAVRESMRPIVDKMEKAEELDGQLRV